MSLAQESAKRNKNDICCTKFIEVKNAKKKLKLLARVKLMTSNTEENKRKS